MLTFNVASNFRQKVGDEWQDRTEWVRVRVLGKRAETLSEHLVKGARVYADGRLEARPWTTREGEIRAGLEMVADVVEFMSPRQDGGGSDGETRRSEGAARPERRPVAAGAGRASRATPADDRVDLEDLPF
jgi:single-strand DNA-binding protein